MPNPKLSRESGLQTKKLIEEALRAGHAPPGQTSKAGEASALEYAAQRLGMARASIHNRLSRMKRMGLEPDWSIYNAPDHPGAESPITAMKDELKSLRRRVAELEKTESLDSQITNIIGGISDGIENSDSIKWLAPSKARGRSRTVPLCVFSDWHIGETVNETHGLNVFNSIVAEQRVKKLVEKILDLTQNYGPAKDYPGIVVVLGGDMISGSIHYELAVTNDMTETESVLHCFDLLAMALDQLVNKFGRVLVVCVAGNHARQTIKPMAKKYAATSYDTLIYKFLARRYAPDKRFQFLMNAENEVSFNIFHWRFLAMHGDQGFRGGNGLAGSVVPIVHGALRVGKQAKAYKRDFDTLIIGHWHQTLWLQNSVIVNNSLKGFCEYAAKILRAPFTPASQTLVYINEHNGPVSYSEIYLQDRTHEEVNDWVSWRDSK